MSGSEGAVGQVRGVFHGRRHAYRRSIDDHGVCSEHRCRKFGVSDHRHGDAVDRQGRGGMSTHVSGGYPQATQPDHDGFRRPARAEHERTAMVRTE